MPVVLLPPPEPLQSQRQAPLLPLTEVTVPVLHRLAPEGAVALAVPAAVPQAPFTGAVTKRITLVLWLLPYSR